MSLETATIFLRAVLPFARSVLHSVWKRNTAQILPESIMSIENIESIEQPYKTLETVGESELIVERSRFIGHAVPVADLDEALAFIQALRAEHYNARHVCYGLRIGRGPQAIDRSNDDGEPSRTGGFPLWQLLEGESLTDVMIVVVRYYGGVKLGPGGLARAYRDTGREAMQAAGIITRYPTVRIDVTIGYDTVGKLEYCLDHLDGVTVSDTTYAADVTFHLDIHSIEVETVRTRLSELLQRPPESFEIEKP